MATVDQCTDAIKNVNGFRIGNDRLIVEFAKSQEEKDRERREKEVWYYENVNAMRFVHFAASRRLFLTPDPYPKNLNLNQRIQYPKTPSQSNYPKPRD